MIYNKFNFKKMDDKKVLRKVKKQWVVVSLSVFTLLGGGATFLHPINVRAATNGNNYGSVNDNQTTKGDDEAPTSQDAKANNTSANNNMTSSASKNDSAAIQSHINSGNMAASNNAVSANRADSQTQLVDSQVADQFSDLNDSGTAVVDDSIDASDSTDTASQMLSSLNAISAEYPQNQQITNAASSGNDAGVTINSANTTISSATSVVMQNNSIAGDASSDADDQSSLADSATSVVNSAMVSASVAYREQQLASGDSLVAQTGNAVGSTNTALESANSDLATVSAATGSFNSASAVVQSTLSAFSNAYRIIELGLLNAYNTSNVVVKDNSDANSDVIRASNAASLAKFELTSANAGGVGIDSTSANIAKTASIVASVANATNNENVSASLAFSAASSIQADYANDAIISSYVTTISSAAAVAASANAVASQANQDISQATFNASAALNSANHANNLAASAAAAASIAANEMQWAANMGDDATVSSTSVLASQQADVAVDNAQVVQNARKAADQASLDANNVHSTIASVATAAADANGVAKSNQVIVAAYGAVNKADANSQYVEQAAAAAQVADSLINENSVSADSANSNLSTMTSAMANINSTSAMIAQMAMRNPDDASIASASATIASYASLTAATFSSASAMTAQLVNNDGLSLAIQTVQNQQRSVAAASAATSNFAKQAVAYAQNGEQMSANMQANLASESITIVAKATKASTSAASQAVITQQAATSQYQEISNAANVIGSNAAQIAIVKDQLLNNVNKQLGMAITTNDSINSMAQQANAAADVANNQLKPTQQQVTTDLTTINTTVQDANSIVASASQQNTLMLSNVASNPKDSFIASAQAFVTSALQFINGTNATNQSAASAANAAHGQFDMMGDQLSSAFLITHQYADQTFSALAAATKATSDNDIKAVNMQMQTASSTAIAARNEAMSMNQLSSKLAATAGVIQTAADQLLNAKSNINAKLLEMHSAVQSATNQSQVNYGAVNTGNRTANQAVGVATNNASAIATTTDDVQQSTQTTASYAVTANTVAQSTTVASMELNSLEQSTAQLARQNPNNVQLANANRQIQSANAAVAVGRVVMSQGLTTVSNAQDKATQLFSAVNMQNQRAQSAAKAAMEANHNAASAYSEHDFTAGTQFVKNASAAAQTVQTASETASQLATSGNTLINAASTAVELVRSQSVVVADALKRAQAAAASLDQALTDQQSTIQNANDIVKSAAQLASGVARAAAAAKVSNTMIASQESAINSNVIAGAQNDSRTDAYAKQAASMTAGLQFDYATAERISYGIAAANSAAANANNANGTLSSAQRVVQSVATANHQLTMQINVANSQVTDSLTSVNSNATQAQSAASLGATSSANANNRIARSIVSDIEAQSSQVTVALQSINAAQSIAADALQMASSASDVIAGAVNAASVANASVATNIIDYQTASINQQANELTSLASSFAVISASDRAIVDHATATVKAASSVADTIVVRTSATGTNQQLQQTQTTVQAINTTVSQHLTELLHQYESVQTAVAIISSAQTAVSAAQASVANVNGSAYERVSMVTKQSQIVAAANGDVQRAISNADRIGVELNSAQATIDSAVSQLNTQSSNATTIISAQAALTTKANAIAERTKNAITLINQDASQLATINNKIIATTSQTNQTALAAGSLNAVINSVAVSQTAILQRANAANSTAQQANQQAHTAQSTGAVNLTTGNSAQQSAVAVASLVDSQTTLAISFANAGDSAAANHANSVADSYADDLSAAINAVSVAIVNAGQADQMATENASFANSALNEQTALLAQARSTASAISSSVAVVSSATSSSSSSIASQSVTSEQSISSISNSFSSNSATVVNSVAVQSETTPSSNSVSLVNSHPELSQAYNNGYHDAVNGKQAKHSFSGQPDSYQTVYQSAYQRGQRVYASAVSAGRKAAKSATMPVAQLTGRTNGYVYGYISQFNTNLKKRPLYVYLKKAVNVYVDANFVTHNKVRRLSVNEQRLTIKRIAKSKSGLIRYYVKRVLSNKRDAYITANQRYVTNAYYTPRDVNHKLTKKIKVISKRGIHVYADQQFSEKTNKFYRHGDKIYVDRIITRNGVNRFYIGKGQYITSNKKFVRFM